MKRVWRADRRALLGYALLVLVLAVRIGFAAWVAHAHPSAVTSPDTNDYLGPARALIHNGRFNIAPGDPTPMFLRTPGYPAVLAAILWVTNSQWAISPIQAALSVVTVVVTIVVARRFIGPTAGLVAGLLVAFDPLQFALSGTILTESLTSLLVIGIVAVGAFVFARRPERVPMLAVTALGLLVAAATMFRPTTWFFPAVVLVLLAIHFRGHSRRALLVSFVAFLVPVVAIVGGWQVRNHSAVHSWEVSGSAGVTLYCYNAATVNAKLAGTSVDAARRVLGCSTNVVAHDAVCPPFWDCTVKHPLANGRGFDEMGRQGLHILARHPVQTAEVVVAGAGREILGPGSDTVRRFLHVRSSPELSGALFVWNLLLWLFALIGAIVALRSRFQMFWVFVICLLAYVVVISAGAESGARFRTPVVPVLAVLAAYGIRTVVRDARRSRSTTTRVAAHP